MFYAYFKKLILGSEDKYHVIRTGGETEEESNIKRDIYLSDKWLEATKEEYDATFTEIGQTPPTDEVAPSEEKLPETTGSAT